MAQFNDGAVLRALNEIASAIVQQAKTNSSWSKDIPGAISSDPANVTSDGFEVDIKIDLKKAPQAGAFEFGSGLHRTRGTPATYEILPRNKKVLAIPAHKWEDFDYPVIAGPSMIELSVEGNFLLRKVNHPGVVAKPYMTPAIIAKLPEARQKLKQAVTVLLNFGGKVEVVE